ncbi:MAG: hypothetical protein ACE149_08370 [Armatimonadota bacterium]
MPRGQRSALLGALVALSVSGWFIHHRIHPLEAGPTMMIPLAAASADVVVVTLLFLSRATARLAYLLNGMFAIYGITTMSHFALAQGAEAAPLHGLAMTLPVSVTLFADFLVGKALFDGYWAEARADVKAWQFLAPGWWTVHFVLIPTVYTVGHFVWR